MFKTGKQRDTNDVSISELRNRVMFFLRSIRYFLYHSLSLYALTNIILSQNGENCSITPRDRRWRVP